MYIATTAFANADPNNNVYWYMIATDEITGNKAHGCGITPRSDLSRIMDFKEAELRTELESKATLATIQGA